MAIIEQIVKDVYVCEHCKLKYADIESCESHELECKLNPNVDMHIKEINKKISEYKKTAKNIYDLLEDIKNTFYEYGIKFDVHFNNLSFKDQCSHGVYSSDKGELCGLDGTISGKIDISECIIPNFKYDFSSDIFGRHSKFESLKFIRTGSGGSRSFGFEYSVSILVEELDYMYNDYLKNHGSQEESVLTKLAKICDESEKVIKKKFYEFYNNDSTKYELDQITKRIQDLSSTSSKFSKNYEKYMNNQFRSKNKFVIPELPHTVFDKHILASIGTISSYNNIVVFDKYQPDDINIIEDFTEIQNLVNSLETRLNRIVEKYPEIYV